MKDTALALDLTETADREEFRRAVLAGLSRAARAIPAKFLYDARGSMLFDAICELPEYYLTRTEIGILEERAGEIARLAGPDCALIEFGSGSSVKSRLLLDAMPDLALYAPIDISRQHLDETAARLIGSSVKSRLLLDAMPDLALYAPIDISRQHLDETAARLRGGYPGLSVEPVCADYMTPEALPNIGRQARRRLGFFPGSTIGNLEPAEAASFLCQTQRLLGNDGALILGVDLKKDPQRLHDAYNDSAGVTADFTLNLLHRMNRELEATFDLEGFAHEAFYNPVEGRIEIYLRSLRRQSAVVAGRSFGFREGERVHTEYSYKYDWSGIDALARSGGFEVAHRWTDPHRLFAVAYLEATP